MLAEKTKEIICLMPAVGFPFGQATTSRILNIGRAIIAGDGDFKVWHYGTSPINLNYNAKGNFDGIEYKYLSGIVKRPKYKILLGLIHAYGIVILTYKLIIKSIKKENIVIYNFLQGSILNIYITLFCSLIKIKIVNEVNEWWPDISGVPSYSKYFYENIMFKYANGATVISNDIKQKILHLNIVPKDFKFISLPVLEDSELYKQTKKTNDPEYLFWCGSVNGYLKDIFFILKAFKTINEKIENLKVIIAGGFNEKTKKLIDQYIKEQRLPKNSIVFTGFVEDHKLKTLIYNASVLLLPLWNDERSKSRFPTKLASYSLSGNPIVSTSVGEVKSYFKDKENILFYGVENNADFAQKILFALLNPSISRSIGSNARETGLEYFSFSKYSLSLIKFFNSI